MKTIDPGFEEETLAFYQNEFGTFPCWIVIHLTEEWEPEPDVDYYSALAEEWEREEEAAS